MQRALTIRPETVHDLAPMADLHARAFGHRAAEAAIVALARQRFTFDPALSLVAERDGRLVGHALFWPHTMRLLDQDLRAVNLAPIAVEPAEQGSGIGRALIEEGHRLAADGGFVISFLLGHPTYYPRFGYRTGAYGAWSVTVPTVRPPSPGLEAGPVQPSDLPGLVALWRGAEAAVDFALAPEPALLDWVSPNPSIEARVYRRDGEIVAYTRIHTSEPARPRVFLARDPEAARAVAADLGSRAGSGDVVLPAHPASAAATLGQTPTGDPWQAAMALEFRPGPLAEYFARLAAGARPVGQVTWPVPFDLA